MPPRPLLIRNARVLTPDRVLPRSAVLLAEGRIKAVGPSVSEPVDAETLDAGGRLLSPGLIDIHINGGFGTTFSDADPEAIHGVSVSLLKEGVTSYLATLLSLPFDRTVAAIRSIGEASRKEGGARILGIHLEGPFLNPRRRGAHRKDHVRPPSLSEFKLLMKESRGLLRMMTLAPELPGAAGVIRCGWRRGVLMAAGHSEATAEELERGVDAGISHVTHLFNAMRPFHHREEGIMDAALLDDRLSCELIYDRKHCTRNAMTLALRLKPPGRLILVSDAMFALRARKGLHRVDGDEYEVGTKEVRLAGSGVLAGSAVSLLDTVKLLSEDFRLPAETVLPMASANPARALGLPLGEIRPGRPADLVVFDSNWKAWAVIVGGRRWK